MGGRDRAGGLVRGARDAVAEAAAAGCPAGGRCRGGFGRVLASRPVEIVCGAIGIFLFALTIYAGFEGTQSTDRQLDADLHLRDLLAGVRAAGDPVRRRLPGVQPVAGDRPGGGVGRADRLRGRTCRSRSRIPSWLGRWPAAAGLFGFAAIELVYAGRGPIRRTSRSRRSVYSAITFIGMALYGVERWMDRGEAFSVYFNLFSRISVFETRDGVWGCASRSPGLPQLRRCPGPCAPDGDDRRRSRSTASPTSAPGTAARPTSHSSSRTT